MEAGTLRFELLQKPIALATLFVAQPDGNLFRGRLAQSRLEGSSNLFRRQCPVIQSRLRNFTGEEPIEGACVSQSEEDPALVRCEGPQRRLLSFGPVRLCVRYAVAVDRDAVIRG